MALELSDLNTLVLAWGIAIGVRETAVQPLEAIAARDLAESLEDEVARRLRAFAPWTRRGGTQG